VLNDVFVSGLPALVGLPVHPRWSRSLQYMCASVCCSRASGQCFLLPEFLSAKCPVIPLCSLSSKIFLIDQYLATTWTKVSWHLFYGPRSTD